MSHKRGHKGAKQKSKGLSNINIFGRVKKERTSCKTLANGTKVCKIKDKKKKKKRTPHQRKEDRIYKRQESKKNRNTSSSIGAKKEVVLQKSKNPRFL